MWWQWPDTRPSLRARTPPNWGRTWPDPRARSPSSCAGNPAGTRWEVTALGGRLASAALGGASLQLEGWGSSWILESLLSDSLTSYTYPYFPPGAGWRTLYLQSSTTLGWTRQWNSWVNSRVEVNQNGGGYWSTDPVAPDAHMLLGYKEIFGTNAFQEAASATLQAGPLLTITPAILCFNNLGQYLAVVDVGLSTSENSTLHLILDAPLLISNDAQGMAGPSEAQTMPSALSLDYRLEL